MLPSPKKYLLLRRKDSPFCHREPAGVSLSADSIPRKLAGLDLNSVRRALEAPEVIEGFGVVCRAEGKDSIETTEAVPALDMTGVTCSDSSFLPQETIRGAIIAELRYLIRIREHLYGQ